MVTKHENPPADPNPAGLALPTGSLFTRLPELGVLLLCILALFYPAVTPEVPWDPMDLVNPPGEWTDAFSPSFWMSLHQEIRGAGFFRPLTALTLYVDKALYGDSFAGRHLTNLLLHLACCLTLAGVLFRLIRNRAVALAGALFFSLHPLRVEPVAMISGRTDILAGWMVLLSLYAFLSALESERNRDAAAFLTGFFFFLGLLAKEVAAPLILFLPVLSAVLRKGGRTLPRRSLLAAHGSCLFFLILYGILRLTAFGPQAPVTSLSKRLGFVFLTFPSTLWRYLGRQLYFTDLARFYQVVPRTHLIGAALFLSWVIVVVGCVIAARKGRGVPLLSCAFFLLFCLPTSGIMPLQDPMADRYQYVPDFAIALLFGAGVAFLISRFQARALRGILFSGLALLLLVEAFVARIELVHWRDNVALWSYDVKKNPSSWRSFVNLGNALIARKDPEGAFHSFLQAAELTGWSHSMVLLNLGSSALKTGRPAEAEKALNKAYAGGFAEETAGVLLAKTYLLQARPDRAWALLTEMKTKGHCNKDCETLRDAVSSTLKNKTELE